MKTTPTPLIQKNPYFTEFPWPRPLIAGAFSVLLAANVQANPIDVFILAGQSNIDARAHRQDLPPELQETRKDILFYFSDHWSVLEPGSSAKPASPNGFGPEISFGRAMADRSASNRRIALIKHSPGGTSLAVDWRPESGREIRTLLKKIQAACQALEAKGYNPQLKGMVWMQGERDATTEEDASHYEANLQDFITYIRGVLNSPELPLVIGRINAPSKPFRDLVRDAQAKVVSVTAATRLIDTDDLGLLDIIHYDAAGLVTLGQRFAAATSDLISE
jgi:hypothetical protein